MKFERKCHRAWARRDARSMSGNRDKKRMQGLTSVRNMRSLQGSLIRTLMPPAIAASLMLTTMSGAYAQQITADGKTETNITENGNVTNITTTTVQGQNAFNSFSYLTVDGGNVANFYLPNNTENLLNVVSHPVSVNGMVNSIKGATIGGNMYFVTPGFVVGQAGVLNVGSLKVVTPSQDYINNFFLAGDPSATATAQVLSGQVPLDSNGYITVQGTINAIGGISLQGGNVTNSGVITTGAVFSATRPDMSDVVNLNGLQSGNKIAVVNGDIEIVAANDVENSGAIAADGADNLKAGNITINAGNNVNLNSGSVLSARGDGRDSGGGDILVEAGNNISSNGGTVYNVSGGDVSGNAGSITLSANHLVTLGGTFKEAAANGTAGSTQIQSASVEIAANVYQNGGDLMLTSSGGITVNPNVIVSTRQTANGAADEASTGSSGDMAFIAAADITISPDAQLLAQAIGPELNAGNITLTGQNITIGNGAQLLATMTISDTTTGAGAGNITLTAAQTYNRDDADTLASANIHVNGATLSGNNITLTAQATASYSWNWVNTLVTKPAELVLHASDAYLDGVNIQTAISQGSSGVTIGNGSHLIATSNVSLSSTSNSSAKILDLVTPGSLTDGAFSLGIVYGETQATAQTEIQSGAIINCRDLAVSATNNATLSVNNFSFSQGDSIDVAVSITKANVNAQALIDDGATITANHSVSVSAVNNNSFSTSATAMALDQGKAGIAAAVFNAETNAEAFVGTNLTTSGLQNVTVVAYDNTTKNKTSASGVAGSSLIVRKLVDPLINPAGLKLVENTLNPLGSLDSRSGSTETEKPKLAGAVTWVTSTGAATASVAADNVINAAGDVVIAAKTSDALLQNFAQSSTESQAKKEATEDNPSGNITLSAALAYGDYTHAASAKLGANAQVTAQRVGIASQVDVPYEITYLKWDGISSLTDKINGNLGLANGFLTGFANAQANASDLGVAGSVAQLDFHNTSMAAVDPQARITILPNVANPVPNMTMPGWELNWAAPVMVFADTRIDGVFAAGNISLLLNGTGSESGGKSMGGSYNQTIYNNTTEAYVAQGAVIGPQNGASPVDITVQANSTEYLFAITPSAGRGASFGLNGTFSLNQINNKTEASVSNEAQITANTLTVTAADNPEVWSISGAFTKTDSGSVGLGVGINEITTHTNAFIGNNNAISGSNLTLIQGSVAAYNAVVAARTSGSVDTISVAGSLVKSEETKEEEGAQKNDKKAADNVLEGGIAKIAAAMGADASAGKPKFGIGVSGSAAINVTDINTAAYSDGATLTLTSGGRALNITAVNNTEIVAAGGSVSWIKANSPTSTMNGGIAGSFALNDLANDTAAYLKHSTISGVKNVAVYALSGGEQLAIALGANVNGSDNQAKSAGLAGSVSMNQTANKVDAYIVDIDDGTSITPEDNSNSSLNIIAYDQTKLGTGGGSLLSGGRGSFGAAVSYTDTDNETKAYLKNATVNNFTNIAVQGYDGTHIAAGGGMIGVTTESGSLALGGAFVISEINNTTSASITNASSVTGSQTVNVTAADTSGISQYNNLIQNMNTDPNPTTFNYSGAGLGANSPSASSILSVAGIIQSTNGSNVGISYTQNKITNSYTATISDSVVNAGNTGTVTVNASSGATITGLSVGVGKAADFAGGGAMTNNIIHNNVIAQVSSTTGQTMTAGTLTVQSSDTAKIDSLAGQVTISTGNAAFGAAIANNNIGDTAHASMSGVDVAVAQRMSIQATNSAGIRTLAATGGGSASFAVNGSIAASQIADTTEAEIRDASANSPTDSITVSAADTATIESLSGSLTLAGSGAVGAAVSVNRIGDITSAYVSGSAAPGYNIKNLTVTSISGSTIKSAAVGIGGGINVGVAGSTATNYISSNTKAYIDSGAVVKAQDNVGVIAQTDDVITNLAGSAGIGLSTAGVGASVTVNEISGDTDAYISGSNTWVNALAQDTSDKLTVSDGKLIGSVDLAKGLDLSHYARTDLTAMRETEQITGVVVNASATHSVENLVANVAGGQYAGIAGTTNVSVIKGNTLAYIDAAHINSGGTGSTNQNLSVNAGDHAYSNGFVGTLAIGLEGAGVGIGADTNVFSNNTKAYITNSADVNALGQITVDAESAQGASSLAASGSGGIVGLVGTASIGIFDSTTKAYLLSDTLNAGSLNVKANHGSNFYTAAGGVTAGGAAAAGSFAIVNDNSTNDAYLDHATVNTGGAISVEADNTVNIDNWSVSGALAGGAGVAGSVVISLINDTTEAYVTDSTLGTSGSKTDSVSVDAVDDVNVNNKAGALGVGVGGWGVGAGASVLELDNTTAAYINDSAVYTVHTTTIDAEAERTLSNIALTVGVGQTAGISGSAAVTLVGQNLTGSVQSSELNKNGTGTLYQANNLADGNHLSSSGGNQNVATGTGLTTTEMNEVNSAGRVSITDQLNQTPATGQLSLTDLTHRTVALVSGNSVIDAGGNVQFTASEKDDSGILTGGLAAGSVGVGGSVGVMDVNHNVQASVLGTTDGLPQVTSLNGQIALTATVANLNSNPGASVQSYQGSAGIVGLGAAVADADVTGNVTASADRGVALQSGSGGILITAQDNSSVNSKAYGFAAGFAAAGIVSADSSKGGTVSAAIGDINATGNSTAINTGSGSLTLYGGRTGQVYAYTLAGTGGVVSGDGSDAVATENGNIKALIGNQVTVVSQGLVVVEAAGAPQVYADQRGYGGALIAHVGIGFATATATPDITANIGANSNITAGLLSVCAVTFLSGENDSAYSHAEAVGIGGYLNVSLNQSTAQTAATVAAGIGANTTLNNGITCVLASNTTKQEAYVSGIAGGLVAAGSFKADANANSTTSATLGDGVSGNAGSLLQVIASGVDNTFARATSGSGGLVAGAAALANTHNGSVTTAILGGGTSAHPLTAGSMIVTGQHEADLNSQTDAINAAVLGASGAVSHNYTFASGSNRETGTVVTAQIAPNAYLITQNIQGLASNTTIKNPLPDGAKNANAGSGGLLNGSAAVSSTEVDDYTHFIIGSGSSITVTGDWNHPLLTNFDAVNTVTLNDQSHLDAGGAIAIAEADSLLTADNIRADVTMQSNSTIDSVGPVNLGARSSASVNANASSKTYGLAGAAAGESNASAKTWNTVTLGTGANIHAYGDISLLAGRDSSGASNNLSSVAYTDLYNKTALPISTDPEADALITQNNTISIASGAMVESVANINLLTDKGITSAYGQGIGKDLYRELLSEIGSAFSNLFGGGDVSLDIHGGSSTDTTVTGITENGSVNAGIQHIQYLDIVNQGASPDSFLAIQPDQITETITIQVGADPDPHYPNDPNHTIPIYRTYTVYRTPGVTYTLGTENLQTNLVARIRGLQNLLGNYSGVDQNTIAALQAEINFLQAELNAMFPGGSVPTTNARIDDVPLITINNVLARSGNINITADSLTGGGTLDAPGDVKISIINNGTTFVRTNQLTIPENAGGYIYFNGVSVNQNADITGRNSTGSFSGDVTAAASSPAPAITVRNTYVPSGNEVLAPNIEVVGNISNLRGDVTISSSAGSVNIQSADPNNPLTAPSIAAGTINITAGQQFVYNSPNSWLNVGGSPRSLWGGLIDNNGNPVPGVNGSIQADQDAIDYKNYVLNNSTNPQSQTEVYTNEIDGSGGITAGGNIFISARYLNINGTIESGYSDYSVIIPSSAALTTEINKDQTNYNAQITSGHTSVSPIYQLSNTTNTAGTKQITAFYNAATGNIELQSIRSQGGNIQLVGEILNTGGGRIMAMDGYSNITVTNNSRYNVVENGLDTGGSGIAGKITITDFAQQYITVNSVGATVSVPVTTTYTRLNGNVHIERTATVYNPDGTSTPHIVNADSDTGSSRGLDGSVTYNPASGERFMWISGEQSTTLNVDDYTKVTGGWDFDWSSNDYDDHSHSSTTTQMAIIPQNGYEEFTARNTAYENNTMVFNGVSAQISDKQWDTYDSWSSGFLGYYKHHQWIHYDLVGRQIYNIYSVKGDYPVGISFIGHDQGSVNINGGSAGIMLSGAINNPTGAVSLTAGTSITATSGQAVITSSNITLSAQTGIGSGNGNAPVSFNLPGNSSSLTARSVSGDINLRGIQGLVRVNQISTGSGGNVSLETDGDIVQAAAGNNAVITGHIVNLISDHGAIGASGQSLNVQVVPAQSGDLTAGLNATAAGNIFLRQPQNDFPLISITSSGGNITIEAANGSLVNANPVEKPDTRNQQQLLALWNSNQLLAGQGAETSQQNTLTAYQNLINQLYQDYWRNVLSLQITQNGSGVSYTAGVSYDPAHPPTFSAAEQAQLARYQTMMGWTGTQMQAFEQQLTQAFCSGSYNPGYNYTVPVAGSNIITRDDLSQGYSWTLPQLETGITNLYFKQTSDTQTVIPDPNVTALNGNVTLLARNGSVGTDTTPVVIQGGDLTSPTEAQRLALAAAEAVDIQVNNSTPSITVLQRRAINVNTQGQIDIEANDHVYLGSQTDLQIKTVQANDSIRIKGQKGIYDVSTDNNGAVQGGSQSVILEAADNSIGTVANPLTLNLNPGVPLTARAGQDIHIKEVSGDLTIASLFTPAAAYLEAQADILGSWDPLLPVVIQANGLTLVADTGSIGSAANPLRVAVGPDANAKLTALATTSGRGIYLESPDMVVNTAFPYLNIAQITAGGVIVLDAENQIVEDAASRINAPSLTTTSVGGQTLTGANTVHSFNAANSGGGVIQLTNTANPLTITGISQTAGGNVSVNNTGSIMITGVLGTTDNISLIASQTITESGGGRITNTALLTTQSSGGQTLSGANTVRSFNAANSGGGDIELANTANPLTITGISQTTGGNVAVSNTGSIMITSVLDTTDNISLTASQTITESSSGRIINTALLTTQSIGGQTLNGANTVTNFNATNSGNGDIQLRNVASPLTITGISQTAGGNVTVSNIGGIFLIGAVDTTNNISLAASQTITESGGGRITNTALLTTQSSGGQTLNGANTVTNFNATNSGNGNIQLRNAASPLTITGISQTAGGNVTVSNTGGIFLTGAVDTTNNISLTASQSITESGSGRIINTALLTTQSSGGQTLTGANTVHSFNAGNSGGGEIQLINTASPLTITGISQIAGGNVTVSNTGGIFLTGVVDTTNNISLTAAQTITESGSGRIINTALLTTQSSGGQILTGANTVHSFNAANSGGGEIQLINTAAPLTITGISQIAGGNVTVSNTGGIFLTGAVDTTNNISLTASQSITESGSGRIINTALLTTQSSGGQTLIEANTVQSFNATNSGGGNIELTNTASPLTITVIGQSTGNVVVKNTGDLTISGAITTAADGNISLTATGNETIGAAVTAGGSGQVTLNANGTTGNIAINAAVKSISGDITATAGRNIALSNQVATSGNVSLTAGGSITENPGGKVLNAALLTISSSGSQTLQGANTVRSFNAANTGSGDIDLTNAATLLTITGISQGSGHVVVSNTGDLTISGTITTGANGAIALTAIGGNETIGAVVTSDSGNIAVTAGQGITLSDQVVTNGNVNLTAGGSITEITDGKVLNAALLTTSSNGSQTLNGANTVHRFNAANNGGEEIELKNIVDSLTITGIKQLDGGDVTVDNTGKIDITGTVDTTGNVELIASETLKESEAGLISNAALLTTASSGGQTLNGANTVKSFNATNSGGEEIELKNIVDSLTITGIKQLDGGDVTVDNTGKIDITGTVDTTGNIELIASETIAESGAGLISNAALLTTSSKGGQTLNGANTVKSFNATNSNGEEIKLKNTVDSLTITGIKQFDGGDVTVDNTGKIEITGTVDTTDDVELIASETIAESGAGLISNAALLTTTSSGGQTLNGTNTVHVLYATNKDRGDIEFTNIANPLTITGISQGSGKVLVTNSGDLTISGAITTAADGDITLTAISGNETIAAAVTAGDSGKVTLNANGATGDIAIHAAVGSTSGDIAATAGRDITLNDQVVTNGNVNLTAGASITEITGGKVLNAASLTTSSNGSQTLTGANTVHRFNAANSGSGAIELTNAANPLTITGISRGSGKVLVTNSGDLTISGAITTAADGDIALTAIGGNETIAAAVTVGGSGKVTLNANGATGDIAIHAAVGSTSGDIAATAGRDITLNDQVATNGNVNLTAGASIIEITGGKVLNAALLTTSSNGSQTLTGANTVHSFNATNSGGGNIELTNAANPLTITGIDQSTGNVVVTNIGNLTNSGAITTAAGGNITMTATGNETIGATVTAGGSGQVTLNATSDIAINKAVNSTSGNITATAGQDITLSNQMATNGNVSLTTGGSITEITDGQVLNAALLTTSSNSSQTLNGANTVHSFNATNSGSGAIELTNVANLLTIIGISQRAGGNITVSNTGAMDIAVEIDTIGNVNLTASQTIKETGVGKISNTMLLTTTSSGGQTLTNDNTVKQFNATNRGGGDIQLTNTASPLKVTGIIQTVNGNVMVDNTGAIEVTGVVDTTSNVNLISTQAITESGESEKSEVGKILNAALLTTISSGGQTLNGANTIESIHATNNGGDIQLTNTTDTLIIEDILQTAIGNVTVDNTGDIHLKTITATAGDLHLTAQGSILNRLGNSDVNLEATNIDLTATNGQIGESTTRMVVDSTGIVNAEAYGDIYLEERTGDLVSDFLTSHSGLIDLLASNGSILVANINAPRLSFTLSKSGATLNLGDHGELRVAESIRAWADNVQIANLIHTGMTPLQISIGGGSKDMADNVFVNATSGIGIVFGKLHANTAHINAQTDILDLYDTVIRDRAEFNNRFYTALAENHYQRLEDFTVQLYPENTPFYLFFESNRMIFTDAYIVNYDPDFILNAPDIRNSFVREAEQNLPVTSSLPEGLTTGNLLTQATLGNEPQSFVVFAPDNLGIEENGTPEGNDLEIITP